MINSLILAVTYFFIPFLCMFISTLIDSRSLKKAINSIGTFCQVNGLMVMVTSFIFYYIVFFIFQYYLKHSSITYFSQGYIILLLLLLITYSYFIAPILSGKLNGNLIKNKEYSLQVKERFKETIPVYICKSNVKNAFTTGILPFSRIIVLGQPLILGMSENEISAVIAHEYAHIKYRHLLKIYFVSILCAFLYMYCMNEAHRFFTAGSWTFFLFAGGFSGLIMGIIPSIYKKHCEYQADAFAALNVGSDLMISCLIKLDELTDGAITRGNSSHPNLKKRIKNIDNV